ncbi:CLUMA_CG010193, isoform A [Clunio marinus]|uniref:CLUMA_CG010193, isoform A n=1 Tax=Clunio marinus TaxID=568069 RepID=A0A1J1I8G5_9DIPT|nr:CLUMA_CG010193, isoform A [Clunio marinus]
MRYQWKHLISDLNSSIDVKASLGKRKDVIGEKRHDRKSSSRARGGGVAIYVRDNIKAKIISKSRANGLTEFLFLEIVNECRKKLNFGIVYNPPDNKSLLPLWNSLKNISKSGNDILMVGDFNINLLSTSTSSKNLINELLPLGLFCTQSEPTNFSNINNPSLIDLVFCESFKLKKLSQISPGSYTTHDAIFGVYDFNGRARLEFFTEKSLQINISNYKNKNICYSKP